MSNSEARRRCVNCLARSGRKLKKIAESSWPEPGPVRKGDGLDELVRHTRVVTSLHFFHGDCPLDRAAGDDGFEGPVGSVPVLVSVHRVVAARDGGDSIGRQLGEIVDGRGRRDVPAVRERMDPRLLGREAQQRLQVVDVRVDAAVGDEPEQMDVLTSLERAERAPGSRRTSRPRSPCSPASGPGRGSVRSRS